MVTKRPLEQLTAWASRGLERVSGNPLTRIVQVAATNLPDATKKKVLPILVGYGFAQREAEFIAKSARWASVIRRDYGEESFWKLIAKFKSTE